jgi:predicted N-formylglutamate amidohydrolase
METIGMTGSFVDSAAASMRLLGAADPQPYFVRNSGGRSAILIIGDHAGREIPAPLAGLGLPAEALDRHIAWDIGAGALGDLLSDRLDAAFIAQRYSRLVIDCNRDPDRPDSICQVSDGLEIPGNLALSAVDQETRRREIFEPYHTAIANSVARRRAAGQPTILLALHSFTPSLGGAARPWRFGVLHLGQSPYCGAVLAGLQARFGAAAVGDNQPYQMDGTDYTVPRHAVANGLDYLELEVRQDLLATMASQEMVAAELIPILLAALPM